MRNTPAPDRQRLHNPHVLRQLTPQARAVQRHIDASGSDLANLVEGGRTDPRPPDLVRKTVEHAHGETFTETIPNVYSANDEFRRSPGRFPTNCPTASGSELHLM